MRKLIKSTLSVALAALMSVSMFAHAGEAVAEEGGMSVSYNIGYMSEYWYRGAYQAESSMSFGADVEMGSMYIGHGGADVSDAAGGSGTEIDLYAGYNFELMSIPMYVGVTGYYYTDNFDRDYEEVNIRVVTLVCSVLMLLVNRKLQIRWLIMQVQTMDTSQLLYR